MPILKFGENIPGGGGKFVSLDSQGDFITFRLAGEPMFEYLHWMELADGSKEKNECVRLNNPEGELECPFCEAGDKPKSKFYYPILNRDTGKAAIFRTSASVHIAIDSEFRDGIDVFKYDYKVTRVGGENPNKFYRVTRLPEPIALTDEDNAELKKAKEMDLEKETGASRKSSVSPKADENFEDIMDSLNEDDKSAKSK